MSTNTSESRPHSRTRARFSDQQEESSMNGSTSVRRGMRHSAIAYCFYAVAIYIALLVASTISADGMRKLHSAFATRLPLQFLFSALGIRRFDLGAVIAASVVWMSFVFLDRSLRSYLLARESLPVDLLARQHRTVCHPLSVLFLMLDGAFFFFGVLSPSGWDKPSSLFSAIVLTGMYLCLTVGLAYLNIVLFLKPERN